MASDSRESKTDDTPSLGRRQVIKGGLIGLGATYIAPKIVSANAGGALSPGMGACCETGPACSETIEQDCLDAGGQWSDGVECPAPDQCPP